ncbi:MAG TPA: right-handed parallel beta-helix repeat-containing protein [Gemmatimonadales bacterium]|nr:right-handed parallel beta-helix repeat-containing protein [Gemmatimonadales bacterium]
MTFSFKLSRRLAQSWVVVVAAAALAACATQRSITNPTPPDTTTNQPRPAPIGGYYASPTGSSAGDGSVARPWDLTTALAGGSGRVQPGDTVWMRAGTYTGNFRTAMSGAVGRLLVFRQYPGEHARIDGTLRADGTDVAFWGFEIMSSAPSGVLPALESRGARQKFINLVIHDAAQQGITFWDEAVDAELYGNIVYNNGTHENLDHGTYVHNTSGTKLIKDNVFFNNLAYGIHVYAGPTDGTQRNVHVIGNVSFNNGTISANYAAKGNILIGADSPDEGMQAVDNLLYFSGSVGENLRVGYTAANLDVVVTGNYVFGGATALVVGDWTNATVANNTVGGLAEIVDLRASPAGHSFSGNGYYRVATAAAWRTPSAAMPHADWQQATGLGLTDTCASTLVPPDTKVFVKPNLYEQGRALVVVYNWGSQSSVSVSLSGVLAAGQRYEVHNVQDMYGPAVASGTYRGGSISLPMTGVAPPARLGRSTPTPPRTGPNFDTFVVVPLN